MPIWESKDSVTGAECSADYVPQKGWFTVIVRKGSVTKSTAVFAQHEPRCGIDVADLQAIQDAAARLCDSLPK